jgi:hypothetical protein
MSASKGGDSSATTKTAESQASFQHHQVLDTAAWIKKRASGRAELRGDSVKVILVVFLSVLVGCRTNTPVVQKPAVHGRQWNPADPMNQRVRCGFDLAERAVFGCLQDTDSTSDMRN